MKVTKTKNISLKDVQDLLAKQNLPYEDVIGSKIDFLTLEDDGNLMGCIGIENYGVDALLRSFAVDNAYKNKGLGKQLLLAMFEKCRRTEVHQLHLLTTTAENYFKQYGFEKGDRNNAPKTIKNTKEFSGICPSSATYMTKTL